MRISRTVLHPAVSDIVFMIELQDMTPIFFRRASSEIPCDEAESAYYLGYKKSSPPEKNVSELICSCCRKMQTVLAPQAVYAEYNLSFGEKNMISFADVSFCSKDLMRNLHNCSAVVLLAATVGAQVDTMIRRAQLSGSAEAAVMQGCGAMFVESLVDLVNSEIRENAEKRRMRAHPRFSPGYGDVPLELQKEFFRLLPCSKIGLSLMDTLIMAPEKSVTAFIGLENI